MSLLSIFASLLQKITKAIFGRINWSPPVWLKLIGRGLTKLNNHRQQYPSRTLVISILTLLALTGISYTWQWYKSRPQPLKISVSGIAPTALIIADDDKPDPNPSKLVLEFSASAAKAELVGKEVRTGISLEPKFEGQWSWIDDRTLIFQPKSDWPVDQKYQVSFDRSIFMPQAILETNYYNFSSPSFKANIESAEFYEDPVDPKNKHAVFTLSFSHAVDKTSLERSFSLTRQRQARHENDKPTPYALGFRLAFSKKNSKVYVHSDSINIEEDPNIVALVASPDMRSSRGGNAYATKLTASVNVPNLENYFRIESVRPSNVLNEQYEMERVLTIESSASLKQEALKDGLSLFVLPTDKPAVGNQSIKRHYYWPDPKEVTPEILALSRPIVATWIPSEHEYEKLQSLKFKADPNSYLLVLIKPGIRAFGDFPLTKEFRSIIPVAQLPRQVSILHDGSILSLSGEKRLSVLTRNLSALQYEVSRVLPEGLVHLSSQTWGDLKKPTFKMQSYFSADNISTLISKIVDLPEIPASKSQYGFVDMSEFLAQSGLTRGLFMLKISGYNKEKNEPFQNTSDQRLILLTDLGMIVKDSVDGTHDVFVHSFNNQAAVKGAKVSILGANGLAIFSATTDENGHVKFPSLKDFNRERAPTVYTVKNGEDFSFLPYDRAERLLNFSRFDTGGLFTSEQTESLQAFLFSDRGIYRPGELLHFGLVVKSHDWKPLSAGVPLELVLSDPRGTIIHKQRLAFNPAGLENFEFQTAASSPTGTYQLSLYVVKDEFRKAFLGSTSARLEEFEPDSMNIKASFSGDSGAAWLSPDQLSASVVLRNLFGTAAQARRVKGLLRLGKAIPAFARYPDFQFYDPQSAKKTHEQDLAEVITDANGLASFDLNLARFENASFQVQFTAEGFEAAGGRSVTTSAQALVSPRPYFVGYKADGDLGFIKREGTRNVKLLAVAPDLSSIDVPALQTKLVEFRYISVLTKQSNGNLAYQSVRKEIDLETTPFRLAAAGTNLALTTAKSGDFAVIILDSKGVELNRISYTVVGQGNVTRSLERNAELQLKLDKTEYSPGDEITLDIKSPYSGSGLITIERQSVLASKWFSTTETSTLQRIKIPENLEGNAYVVVTFLRALDSPEIYMSPLSYAAQPFKLSRSKRLAPLSIKAPDSIKPGQNLRVNIESPAGSKNILYMVDEGILQVARYNTPNPIEYFFRKRALEVRTYQILDLLLPEYSLVQASAPGGDQAGLLAHNLNPFKRRGQKPVVYWSGIYDSDGKARDFDIPVPDYFNGTVRLIALTVSDSKIAVKDSKVVVRGDFVIKPSVPYIVAPGDSFSVSALVSNNLPNSGKEAKLEVELLPGTGLRFSGPAKQTVIIPENAENSVSFDLVAQEKVGTNSLQFRVSKDEKVVTYTLDLSIRPAQVFRSVTQTGMAQSGLLSDAKVQQTLARKLYPELRNVSFAAATSPLVLLHGLIDYLRNYPYGCTEQILSQAIPGVVLGVNPEFGISATEVQHSFATAMQVLTARQNSDGAFSQWNPAGFVSERLSIFATQFLLESQERGLAVPALIFERAISALNKISKERRTSLAELRNQAQAIYILTRNGLVTTSLLKTLKVSLNDFAPKQWQRDIAALYLAASLKILNLDAEAEAILAAAPDILSAQDNYREYSDPMSVDAQQLYLRVRHFPDSLSQSAEKIILSLANSIIAERHSSLTSALAILALDQYARSLSSNLSSTLQLKQLDAASKEIIAVNLQGLSSVAIDRNVAALQVVGESKQTIFYQLVESGFELPSVVTPESHGIEVSRDFRNAAGESVNEVKLGEKVWVHVMLRSIGAQVADVALVDLLPGAFEVEISPEGLASHKSLSFTTDTWQPDYTDVREDRIVFYGLLQPNLQRFVYQIKPSSPGTFTVPALFAEGMYDRRIKAISASSSIKVTKP